MYFCDAAGLTIFSGVSDCSVRLGGFSFLSLDILLDRCAVEDSGDGKCWPEYGSFLLILLIFGSGVMEGTETLE